MCVLSDIVYERNETQVIRCNFGQSKSFVILFVPPETKKYSGIQRLTDSINGQMNERFKK